MKKNYIYIVVKTFYACMPRNLAEVEKTYYFSSRKKVIDFLIEKEVITPDKWVSAPMTREDFKKEDFSKKKFYPDNCLLVYREEIK